MKLVVRRLLLEGDVVRCRWLQLAPVDALTPLPYTQASLLQALWAWINTFMRHSIGPSQTLWSCPVAKHA